MRNRELDDLDMSILDEPGRWSVEWIDSPVAGKRVFLRNRITGQVASGHDWNDWDQALSAALQKVHHQGDLVTEIEDFLDETQ